MLGAPFDQNGEPCDESNALSERAARRRRAASESKGQPTSIHFHCAADDGIVVGMWFVYILCCCNGSFYEGETNDVAQRVADP